LKNDLAFINANFSSLTKNIKILESRDLLINENVQMIEDLLSDSSKVGGDPGKKAHEKLKNVLKENPGYTQIRTISNLLTAEDCDEAVELDPKEMSLFRYAPATSCDVERSFSQYKSVLSNKRINLTENNLSDIFISHCNRNL
jgi:hypothetical protein